jgi:hypothetical protein
VAAAELKADGERQAATFLRQRAADTVHWKL